MPSLKQDIFQAVAKGFAKSPADWSKFSWLWQNQVRVVADDRACKEIVKEVA